MSTQRERAIERESARGRERRPAVAKEGAELSGQTLAQLAHRNVLLLQTDLVIFVLLAAQGFGFRV